MQLIRIFSTAKAKGTEGYIRSQKKYEVIRTLLYFAVSLSLYVAGYIQTGQRANLLTIVAVLGCLPASKSAVSAIMFLRARGCSAEAAKEIEAGDTVEIDFDSGIIYDRTKNTEYKGQAFPPFMQKIIKAEGLINYINENK